MVHMITGGSGSGKSEYAESLVLAAGEGRRVYIATMIPYGTEGSARVARHRRLRREKQFETIERYTDLAGLSVEPGCIVLLECVSNLVANEVFEPCGAHEHTADRVVAGIRSLSRQAKELFVVTNEVFSDGVTYDAETERYLSYLGEVNCRLAAMADSVTEVVYGIPVRLDKKMARMDKWTDGTVGLA